MIASAINNTENTVKEINDLTPVAVLGPENQILAESRSLIEVPPQPRGAPAGRRLGHMVKTDA